MNVLTWQILKRNYAEPRNWTACSTVQTEIMQVQRGDQPPLPTNGNSSVACSMPKVLHAPAECVKVVIDFDLAFLVPMTISGLHTHTIPMFEGYSENVAPCPVSFCVAKIGCAWKQTYRHRILLHPHSPREEALFPKVPSSNENYSNHGTSALNTSGPKRKYQKKHISVASPLQQLSRPISFSALTLS